MPSSLFNYKTFFLLLVYDFPWFLWFLPFLLDLRDFSTSASICAKMFEHKTSSKNCCVKYVNIIPFATISVAKSSPTHSQFRHQSATIFPPVAASTNFRKKITFPKYICEFISVEWSNLDQIEFIRTWFDFLGALEWILDFSALFAQINSILHHYCRINLENVFFLYMIWLNCKIIVFLKREREKWRSWEVKWNFQLS